MASFFSATRYVGIDNGTLMDLAKQELLEGKQWQSCTALAEIIRRNGKLIGQFFLYLRDSNTPYTVPIFRTITEMSRRRYFRTSKAIMTAVDKKAVDVITFILRDLDARCSMMKSHKCMRRALEMDDPWFLELFIAHRHLEAFVSRGQYSRPEVVLPLARQGKVRHFKACMRTFDPDDMDWLFPLFDPVQAFGALFSVDDLPDCGIAFYKAMVRKFKLVRIPKLPTTNGVLTRIYEQELLFSPHKIELPEAAQNTLDAVRLSLVPHIGPDCANLVYMFSLDLVQPTLRKRAQCLVCEHRTVYPVE